MLGVYPNAVPPGLAVAAGFEPAEVLPSLAFEASTFGRSDTLPQNRVTATRPANQIPGHDPSPVVRMA